LTEISFYHLTRQPLNEALPALLQRVLAAGKRAVVVAASEERVETLDQVLWTYDPDSFLPHGSAKDGYADKQPIYLTTGDENPNAATVLVSVDGMEPPAYGSYERFLYLFDDADREAVDTARQRWKKYKSEGHTVTYWQQRPGGGWEKKG
jgi:DNA polymerase-3 subunit chi